MILYRLVCLTNYLIVCCRDDVAVVWKSQFISFTWSIFTKCMSLKNIVILELDKQINSIFTNWFLSWKFVSVNMIIL